MYFVGKANRRITKATVQVRWNRSSVGWCKLNSDGLALGNPKRASRGGLIHGWIKGFTRNIGISSSVEAELWALRDGLSLCISINIMALEIEEDVKVILEWMSNEHSCNLNNSPHIMDCRALINQVPQVRMMHCFLEANKCADALARNGPVIHQDLVIYDNPLVDIIMLLYYNEIGMYYERIRLQTVGFLG
ncbi:hypothetical protein SO802_032172 [Lithocarpus litseifolius]|uniref:RNase H type-1 domain-containing protein n=1 Tax=Lithocarpus litseifolius TaxID=425828 RepID=A0AAW2BPG1_9ROSI